MLKKNEVSHLEVLYYLQKNFAYFLVLSLVVTTVSFRSLDRSIGAIKRLDFLNTHYWLLPMFLFVASSIYLIFAKSNDLEYGNSISLYTGVILFLVLRDVFVYLHFSIAKNIKRPISFFLFYAFFVYFLLPLVLKGIAFALDLPWAKSLLDFKSIGNEFPLVSLISYALQSLVAFGVLFLSYRKHRQWALTVEESRD